MEIDANKEIRRAVDTGKVVFGSKEAQKNVLKGNGKLLIVSRNTPLLLKEKIKLFGKVSQIPFYDFKGSGLTLGSVCGKPFIVSCLLVQDVGKSKIMDLLKEENIVPKKASKSRKPVAKKTLKSKNAKSVKKQ